MPILRRWAERDPDKIAALMAFSDQALTYGQLDRRSNAVAQLLMWLGLAPGDSIAIMLDNDLTYFEIMWGARRHGVYYTPVSAHLSPEEAAYIVRDSGAKAFFVASHFAAVVQSLQADSSQNCAIFSVAGALDECADYELEVSRFDRLIELPDDGLIGRDFCYSSGTTGKPKGIKQPLFTHATQAQLSGDWVQRSFGFDQNAIYLSPAPLYHAAPLRFTMRTLDTGGTAVIMKKFAAEQALAAIERYRITHSQWVPTMFFRLLSLPQETRSRYDLSSHRCAVHAAAPCPPEIKQQMIDWWGPIVWEYYAGSERNGATCISTEEWLAHRGSVGRACVGKLHILDENKNELEVGEIGDVFFEGPKFVYHNDPEKTASSQNDKGWSTIGDVGYLDRDGYLYLTDRRSHMIISGGVNIYPAEIENRLALHPAIADVAVFGIPNQEYGEEVKAVVQLKDPSKASSTLAAELIAFCRDGLSHVKCPRSVDFESVLPRQENGKLFKHLLKQRYLKSA
jgi:long-chain acyl-CoA synthetase